MPIKQENFALHPGISGVTAKAVAVTTGQPPDNAWTFQVPVGQSFIFTGEDTFSAYLQATAGGGGAELAAGCVVDVVKKPDDQQGSQSLLNQCRYALVKEFQTVNKLAHLDIDPGKEVVVNEGEWVIVRLNPINKIMDTAVSYFNLTCKRVRKAVFA